MISLRKMCQLILTISLSFTRKEVSNKVIKDELLKLAEELFRETFDANSYFLIMQQYGKHSKKYKAEMDLSPAFYNIVYNALQVACFMELAKLYDKTGGVFTIGSLLKDCQANISLFPEYRAIKEIEVDGEKYIFQIPYQHELKPDEERFFEEQVQSQREILKLFDVEHTRKTPVVVDLKFSEYLSLYQKKFNALSKKQKNIRIQRNKLYAHNDLSRLLGEDISTQAPIHYSDIQELIDFALSVTQLIIACLTDIYKVGQYANIDDWEGTLMLAQLGLKYQDYDLKQQMKEFEEQLRSQTKE